MADLEVLCRTSTVLYTSRGRSPQPVREASAGPGQNPGSPGPKGPAAGSTLTPVRACQPSGILESTAPVPIPTAPQAPEPSSPKGVCPMTHQKNPPLSGWILFISLPFSRLLSLSSFPLSFLPFLRPVLQILPLYLPVLSLYTRRSRGPGRREGPVGWPRRGRR